ncbi:MAG: ROK family protein [bacterium]|nr:ROK family protein [bacterium]
MRGLVFDIGGTNTRVALVSASGRLGKPVIFPTSKNGPKGVKKIAEEAKKMIGSGAISFAVGGLPKLIREGNLQGWIGHNIKSLLYKKLRCPIQLENDAALAGLGEAHYGAGKGKSILAYITASTGIGGVRIVDGEIDRSTGGFEPGHHVIDAPLVLKRGPRSPGYWEKRISGSALEKRFGKTPKEITDPKVWKEFREYFALGLVNVSIFWSPETIVVGGSLLKHPQARLSDIRRLVKRYCYVFQGAPAIVRAKLGDIGGLYGALHIAKKQFFKR